tara:strand:+ start:59 stop:463 length:405 start_codon:yes stop_codon:yes gene_type:complete
MPSKNKKGAGVLIFRDFDNCKKVLILLNQAGKFDIPKGHVDKFDVNIFATAQRECYEETQIFITLSDLLTPSVYQDNNLTIFCASTLQDPSLERNPETGILEHVKFYWLPTEIAAAILPKYLSQALLWGLKQVS